MQGYSGSYAVNGVNISQPSQGKLDAKDSLGINGLGVAIYPLVGQFTLSWGLLGTDALKQLIDLHVYTQTTGTVVCDLPKWGDVDYLFQSYSGTVVNRPTVGAYFNGWVEDVQLVISNIRTS